MNGRQKLVQQQFLNNEEGVIKRLTQVYTQASKDINQNIADLMARSDANSSSVVYQVEYQKAIQKQIDGILDTMNAKQFTTVSDYLQVCYEDGFVGTMFDLQGQGVPFVLPMNQEQIVRAVQLDSKINGGMYASFGEDTKMLKKHITAQISRGISTGMSYEQVAQQISLKMMGTKYKPGGAYAHALNIARTEGHRIQCQSGFDALYKARDKGADITKEWDSTLDGVTRPSHRQVDGEIRELDEEFSNGLQFPGDPHGAAEEVCNCRCALLQRARWALGNSFTKKDGFTGELREFATPKDYDEFKKWYFSDDNVSYMNYVETLEKRHKTKDFAKLLESMNDVEYKRFKVLEAKSPLFSGVIQKSVPVKVKDSIEHCKSVEEVENLFKQNDWFVHASINGQDWRSDSGLSLQGADIESAKAVYRAYKTVFDKYPSMIGKMSAPNCGKLAFNEYANCTYGFGNEGITINSIHFRNYEKLKKEVSDDIAAGFHPVGTEDPYSMVVHEIGHAIDGYLTFDKHIYGFNGKQPKHFSNTFRPKVLKACNLKTGNIETEVSGYATKNPKEFFAESFAEYMCSENPRKVASEVGRMLDDIMKGIE